MPTASERARSEAAGWAAIADHWDGEPVTEARITLIHDPVEDLRRRGSNWSHHFEDITLSSLATFSAGLAIAESTAWDNEQLDVATRAYEERRFLLGDRLIHWAVPWLASVSYADNSLSEVATSDMEFMLQLGDEMRVAPEMPGTEGMVLSGEDSFGPLAQRGSLWSGWVETGSHQKPSDVARFWTKLARDHPGTAQLWMDLAVRAED